MRWSRRQFFGLAAGAVACAHEPLPVAAPAPLPSEPTAAEPPAGDPVERAVAWLWSKQSVDGGFRSETYALFADGQSLSPYLALALLGLPPRQVDPERLGRLFGFIMALPEHDGAIGFRSMMPDYPVYATSLALRALSIAKPAGWESPARAMAAWISGQQFKAEDGWQGHPAEGGFGLGSRIPREPPHAGHVDLSMTRRALEALHAYGSADAVLDRARLFIHRCQVREGGFIYSPVDPGLNKAGTVSDGSQIAYGSATADGILALLTTRADLQDPDLLRALVFLKNIHNPDMNPGIIDDQMAPYRAAMKGYYRAAAADVFARLGGPDGWAKALRTSILAEQLADGSWKNDSALQKEDDPLVATAMALTALSGVDRSFGL